MHLRCPRSRIVGVVPLPVRSTLVTREASSIVQLKGNGQTQSFKGDPEMPLLWYLRDILGFTGTKFGCGMGLCGACTVLQNGKAIRSCSKPMGTVDGLEITTIEAISSNGPHVVQKAWAEVNVPQCGHCQP